MSDLDNFEPSNDTADRFSFRQNDTIQEPMPVFKDSGGLGLVHRSEAEWEEPGSNRSKILSALVVALLMGGAGAYIYTNWTPAPKQAVADSSLPKTAAIAPTPAETAPAETTNVAAPTPTAASTRQARRSATAMATKKGATAVAPTPEPVTAKAPTVTQPQSQDAAIPGPVSPTPPASSVAGNPSQPEQSAPASDVPVTQAAPGSPVPAQPDDQLPQ